MLPVPRQSADDLIRSFDGLKAKSGGGWIARCPAHEDRQQSLSIDVRDGKILLKCFAGCDARVVAAAKGLTMADLFLEDRAAAVGPVVVPTRETLAAVKGLPLAVLERYGVRNVAALSQAERFQYGVKASEGVWIPYFNPDGTVAGRTRLRSAMIAKDGSRWCGSFGAPLPYGLHDLADAGEQGIVAICEGETDYWSLRAMGVPAIGMAGATMTGGLKREYLPAGVRTVYVTQDSDTAGAGFVASVRALVEGWGLSCLPVKMPAGCKDVNDLYRQDPATAADRFLALLSAAAVADAPGRVFSTAGEIYRYTLPEWGLLLEIDQVRRNWGDMTGELAVLRENGADVFRGTINLSNVERRQGVALQIAKRVGLKELSWPDTMEEFANACLSAEKQTGAVVMLADVPLPAPDATWQIDQFHLSRRDATCLFGDGGTGKSLIAAYLIGCLARQGVRVMYLDAEWTGGIHRERMESLFGLPIPPVAYLEHRKPLETSLGQVRRRLIEYGIEYLVLDSVGLLTVGAPEESGAALGFSRAVQQLGVGTLTLAHVRKPQGGHEIKPQDQKPFGSVFYHNLFRRTYFVKADPDGVGEEKRIVTWNPKWNHRGKGQAPFGLAFRETGARTEIVTIDAADVEGLRGSLSSRRQIMEALRGGAIEKAEIVRATGLTAAVVSQALQRGRRAGYFVLLPGPDPRWANGAKEDTNG